MCCAPARDMSVISADSFDRRTVRIMEVFDLQDVVDEEQCEKLLEFAEQYSIFGKQDFLDALSRLQITGGSHLRSLRSGNRRSIVLARKDPANYAVHGAVLVEYLVDLNCGIVCAISVVDRSEENGRVLMGMISTALDKVWSTPFISSLPSHVHPQELLNGRG